MMECTRYSSAGSAAAAAAGSTSFCRSSSYRNPAVRRTSTAPSTGAMVLKRKGGISEGDRLGLGSLTFGRIGWST